MSLEALIIFSLLNAGQLAENTQSTVHIHKNPADAYVYVEKQEDK
ncbi:transporter [Bacillus pseudomycoides]|uniref:Transporter n=1 Tax=Bacillus pseudomycoides TaxID=64104 RepID=A0AA91ZTG7_9BACI|nr:MULTISPECIES: transporter [Bacillus]PEB48544.1 transporter [Bacillus sp. AFS098217]PED81608.1 transporter [Bacillus pseudomycoides]PEU07661.1 transporter [Bacillus sp. AFS019443]PEU16974.1 transporter [Bacillus sp. AFS014408]PFW61408.1 transporter [Bacillus sp. AFS075034]